MDGFLPANWGARRLSDLYLPISSPATFLSLCESLLAPESEEVRRREMSALPVLSRSATGKWCKEIRESSMSLKKLS